MWSRTAVLAAMLIMAPLGANSADFVVWWEEGLYPREDAAVADVVAAFEQESGKKVEIVIQPVFEVLDKTEAAIEAGHPPDFLFGTTVESGFAQWAYGPGRRPSIASLPRASAPSRRSTRRSPASSSL
jgi:multiple sugar transport system substrate-binding protein